MRRRCPCGHESTGVFPVVAKAPVCWGPEVRALALYLLCRQHLAVQRCAELLGDVIGAPVSTGWLCAVQLEAGRLLARSSTRYASSSLRCSARMRPALALTHESVQFRSGSSGALSADAALGTNQTPKAA